MAVRRDMRDVELVEVDVGPPRGHADEALPPSTPPADPDATRRRTRRALLPVGAVVVLVLAAGWASDVREASRLADLAGVEGVVAPLDGPVRELWRTEAMLVTHPREVEGHLVMAEETPAGGVDVVALDPLTGGALWRTPVRSTAGPRGWTHCAVPGAPAPASAASATRAGGPEPVVACLVVDEVQVVEGTPDRFTSRGTVPTRVRLTVVDTGTGELLSDAPVDPSTQLTTLATDVVLSRVDADGFAVVERVDPRSGARRWSFTSTEPVDTDMFPRPLAPVTAVGELVTVEAGHVSVLSGDGTVLRTWETDGAGGFGGYVHALDDRGRRLARQTAGDDGLPITVVVDLVTGREATVEGFPLQAQPDDGSLEGLVLVQSTEGSDVVAYDVELGTERWTAPATLWGLPAVLDGRVLLSEESVLRSLDGRTGEEVWSTDLGGPSRGSAVTDGRVAVVGVQGPDGARLVAYGLDDGRERWAVDAPSNVHLFGVDRRLYAATDDGGLVALG